MYSATPSKDRAAQRRKSKHPPNYFSKREQYRLLLLVGSVMLVVILISEAGKPKNWAWMWGNEGPEQADVAQQNSTNEDINTRLHPTRDLIADDPELYRISPAPLPTDDEGAGEDEPTGEEEEGDYFPGVRPSLLSVIQDDHFFKNNGAEAWYNLLGVLLETEQAVLDEASIGDVGYLQLKDQPDSYRGRLVSVKGTVCRVQQFDAPKDAPENVHHIEGWYQCTLFPEGGPRGLPILVYCLDLPDGFPREFDMYQEVHLTGFFYKKLAYAAGDGPNSAPLILAKTLTWDRTSIAQADPPPWYLLVAAVLGAVVIAVAVAVWAYSRSQTRSEKSVAYGLSKNFDSVNLNALKDLDISPGPRFPDES